jgi:hypothetical protein
LSTIGISSAPAKNTDPDVPLCSRLTQSVPSKIFIVGGVLELLNQISLTFAFFGFAIERGTNLSTSSSLVPFLKSLNLL